MLMWIIPAAMAMDHSALQGVLTANVSGRGNVDYAAIQASGALDGYLDALSRAAEPTDRAERMAFWINAYNALTIDMIADNYPLASIRDLDGGDPWGTRRFTVAGRSVTLNAIEHDILRPLGDARIHAAVNCASRGCPPLSGSVFTGAGLDGQLDAAAARWMQSNGIRVESGAVHLSKIFDWYGDDFLADSDFDIPGVSGREEAAINFAVRYLPQQASQLRAGGYTVDYSEYSWSLNKQ
jgi:hypothetical protein